MPSSLEGLIHRNASSRLRSTNSTICGTWWKLRASQLFDAAAAHSWRQLAVRMVRVAVLYHGTAVQQQSERRHTKMPCAPCPRRRYTYKAARSGFWTGDLAQRFRAEAYRRHGIVMPPAAPRTITLLNNAHSEKVVSRPATLQCQPPPQHPALQCACWACD